jgi:DNA polymerase
MQELSIDIETYCDRDLKKCGVYKYTESPAFEIILFTYSIDDGPEITIDLTCDIVPPAIVEMILSPEVLKSAYNAAFERRCLSVHLKQYLAPEQWQCTMIKAAMVGLPFGLDNVAKALRLEQGKLTEGRALIKYFCSPCKPTKTNGMRERNIPYQFIYKDGKRNFEAENILNDKWAKFMEYNKQDVVIERIIANKISFFEIPEKEKQLWALDQKMNDKGVLLDQTFINAAIKLDKQCEILLIAEARELTGMNNPNSDAQLKKWLTEESGEVVTSLTKNSVIGLLKDTACDKQKRMLEIKQELNKRSNKKYYAMLDCVCADGRARGTIQYYGAGRTGRYSGRLFQPQNLTKTVLPNRKKAYDYYELSDGELQTARDLILDGCSDTIEMLFGNVPDTLSACIRTALIAEQGKRFMPVDSAQIEARVLAWLAGEKWKLDAFKSGVKIYQAAGAIMFKVPIESVKKGTQMYDKSKIGELALGYQGGINALIAMGALEMGLVEDELQPLVYDWRNVNKKIVQCWYDLNECAIKCVKERTRVKYNHGISFHLEKGIMFITLPSGRRLAYLRPEIVSGKFGGDQAQYEGVDTKSKQWGKRQMYGGLICENLCQAIARDVLCEKMLLMDKAGYNLLLSVHDEAIPEETNGTGSLNELIQIMSKPVEWAPTLPLGADGFENWYYKK